MTLTNDLATFATGPVPATQDMQQAVSLSLFDWATVGLAGRDEPVSQMTRAAVLDEESGAQATVFGGGRASARGAALVNGATSHALDYDDTHFLHIGHPSVAITPAALAVAEWKSASGAEFLLALAVGLELSCRIGDWLGRSHYEAGFHQTGTAGAFGATAAAGRLLGLDANQMAHALGLTATRAAGLKSQFGTMGKPLNAGFAAEVGVTCATLAAHGVASNPAAIHGLQGFGPTHAGSAWVVAFDGLGTDWVFPKVSYKFHACCHGLHAMLESLRTLKAEGLTAEAVDRITIHTHPRWLDVCNQPKPTTGLGSKFSYRLTAAMCLADVDTAALDSYVGSLTQRPDLVALRDKVTVKADGDLTDMQSRVVVDTAGDSSAAFHDLAQNPDPVLLARRLREKSATLVGDDTASRLWTAVNGLSDASDLGALTGLLAG